MSNRKVPRMTRGHYNMIADVIGNLNFKEDQKVFIARVFADRLSETNPRFSKDRFIDYVTNTNVRKLKQAAKAMRAYDKSKMRVYRDVLVNVE